MEWWDNVWRTKAKASIYEGIRTSGGNGQPEVRDLVPQKDYLSISIEAMWIVDVGKLWNRFYGVAHSHCTVDNLSGKPVDIAVVAAPDKLKNVDPKHLDREIVGPTSLVRKIPYVGGAVLLEVGLVSVKGDDLAAPYIRLLESLTKVAGVSALSPLATYAGPIKDGFAGLLGAGNAAELEIGTSRQIDPPKSGYYLMMRASRDEIDPAKLTYDLDTSRLVDGQGRPVERFPYLVLKVTASQEKDDYYNIPELGAGYSNLVAAARKGDSRRVKEELASFVRMATYSMDLLPDDGKRLAESVKAQFERAAASGLVSKVRGPAAAYPSLQEVGLFSARG
ncbi:MAG TPA: hypothetical protein VG820_11520 [Fimbriimonadaceae bacterium]|nr:hypothetical protein [Fimbriimonadaceae bacterium]